MCFSSCQVLNLRRIDIMLEILQYVEVAIWQSHTVRLCRARRCDSHHQHKTKYQSPGPTMRLPTLPTLCVCVWVCDPGSRCRGLAWPGCCPLSGLVLYQASPPPLLLSFRIWAHAESPLHQNCRRNLVVFHTHHHLLLHGKPGCLPHCGEDGVTHRLCWRPG